MWSGIKRPTEDTPLCLGRRRRRWKGGECGDLLKSMVSAEASEGVMRENHCGALLIRNLFASSGREGAIRKERGGGVGGLHSDSQSKGSEIKHGRLPLHHQRQRPVLV